MKQKTKTVRLLRTTCGLLVIVFGVVFLSHGPISAANSSKSSSTSVTFLQSGSTASANESPHEVRAGQILGKARIKADGTLAFQISPSVGVFRKQARTFEVVVSAQASFLLFSGAEDLKGETITEKEALAHLNGTPTLVSLDGYFDANTNTFHVTTSLEIVA